MEEKIKHALLTHKIEQMINPSILLNTEDLQFFIKKLESQITNFSKEGPITYEGILLIPKDYIVKGQLIIFDNINKQKLKNIMLKKKAKVSNCKYFKSCGNVFGGCKHPSAKTACLHQYLDECSMSERKYKLKAED